MCMAALLGAAIRSLALRILLVPPSLSPPGAGFHSVL